MLSYCEFQFPWLPSVGSHCGKQSYASTNVRLRMMTLSTWSTTRFTPTRRAPSTPTIVVFGLTFSCTRGACFLGCAARALRSTERRGVIRLEVCVERVARCRVVLAAHRLVRVIDVPVDRSLDVDRLRRAVGRISERCHELLAIAHGAHVSGIGLCASGRTGRRRGPSVVRHEHLATEVARRRRGGRR